MPVETFTRLNKTILGHITTGWGVTSDILYPNVNSSAKTVAHIRINIFNTGREPQSLGGGYYRINGIVIVNIFDLMGAGPAKSQEFSNKLAELLDLQDLSDGDGGNIVFRAGNLRTLGNDGNGFYQSDFEIPFYYDRYEA